MGDLNGGPPNLSEKQEKLNEKQEKVMAKRYFEYKDAKSSKFWEVSASGKKVNIRYGKIGTDGQTTLKELGSPADAKAHAEKQAAGKVKKGYKEVT